MPDDKAKGKALIAAYRRAGADFLAIRLEGMFRTIVTPEDMALHNIVLQEVLAMVGDDPKRFFQTLSHKVLFENKAKKNLLRKTVEAIFSEAKG